MRPWERVITVPAHARPTDTKRSHRSARSRWVTFWVTQKSHRAKTLIAERFTVRVRFLPATHCVVDQHVMGGVTSPPSAQARRSHAPRLAEAYAFQDRPA